MVVDGASLVQMIFKCFGGGLWVPPFARKSYATMTIVCIRLPAPVSKELNYLISFQCSEFSPFDAFSPNMHTDLKYYFSLSNLLF